MGKNKNKVGKRFNEVLCQMKQEGVVAEFRQQVKSNINSAFRKKWAEVQTPPVLVSVSASIQYPGNLRSVVEVTYVINYHGVYAQRQISSTIDLDRADEHATLRLKINNGINSVLKRIPNDVASLPKKYSAEAPHDCQFEGAFKNVQYQYFSTDYKEPGAVSFSELVQALDLNTQDMESQISNDLKMQLPGKAKEMGELPENRRPICEIQSKIELRENPDFTVTVSVNLSAFYKDEELRRSVSAKKSTRQLFQEFREKNRESTEDILGAVECAAREAAGGVSRIFRTADCL